MDVSSTTAAPVETGADTIVVGLFAGEEVAHDLPGAPLGELLRTGEASTDKGRVAVTRAEGRRFILVGLGPRDGFDGERARAAAASALTRARELRATTLCWEVPHHVGDEVITGMVEGTMLRDYRFDRFKRPSDDRPPALSELILSAHHDISEATASASTIAAATNRARDLGNTPGNELTPTALAEHAAKLEGVEVTVLDEDEIRAAGMGAFASVAQGSVQSAKLIRLDYMGAGENDPTIGFIGKAVTFDSGGLSLKSAPKMHEMKFDMLGGAAVIEAIGALAQLKVPVNVLGVVGATENLPSGRATKPGDIVTASDGTTIEVNNTDAEGRLVLADCIAYARREGATRLVDLATLTGGIVVALGSHFAGLFSNDDEWAARFEASAARTGDRLWRLPLHAKYAEMVKGQYADLTNQTERREASAVTAAEFLHHFAGDAPWAHVDIAGTAYDAKSAYIGDKGATGFGVRLLVDVARSA